MLYFWAHCKKMPGIELHGVITLENTLWKGRVMLLEKIIELKYNVPPKKTYKKNARWQKFQPISSIWSACQGVQCHCCLKDKLYLLDGIVRRSHTNTDTASPLVLKITRQFRQSYSSVWINSLWQIKTIMCSMSLYCR